VCYRGLWFWEETTQSALVYCSPFIRYCLRRSLEREQLLATSARLLAIRAFLWLLHFGVGPPNETDRQSGVFATNAILCLKPGEAKALSAPVKQQWFSACRSFLKWTIEESSAPTVITLGRPAYESVTRAYGIIPRSGSFREVVETISPIRLDPQRCLFAVFHPAARPKDRTLPQMRGDWTRISEILRRRLV
jgi:Uracil DNA glycosylase superfamily